MPLDLYYLMMQAVAEAEKALAAGEVPVGAVVSDADGRVQAKGHNQSIALMDPTAHAEIQALRRAAGVCGNYRLPGAVLVVTLEPCVMCMGAAVNARIARLVFGVHDPKTGGAGSLYNIGRDERLNHRIEITHGIMKAQCRTLMQDFFRARR
ncbi:MAG: tRNA adenosine(34) deaminase TadA [Desulfatiglandaceae bacterium]